MKIQFAISTIKHSKRNSSSEAYLAMEALALSAKALGHEVIFDANMKPRGDVAFFFGSTTNRKLLTERFIQKEQLIEAKIPTFHIDTGFFASYVRDAVGSLSAQIFRIGLNDCVGTGDFLNSNSDKSRFELLKKAFHFKESEPRISETGPILFLTQNEKGWQYDEPESFTNYSRSVISKIRSYTDRDIVLRIHPISDKNKPENMIAGFKNIKLEFVCNQRLGILDSIRNAYAVVTHSSSAAVESIVEGIPTFVLSNRGIAYNAAENDLSKIIAVDQIDWSHRNQHLYDWANATWHLRDLYHPPLLQTFLQKV